MSRPEQARDQQAKWNAVQLVSDARHNVVTSTHPDPMAALQAAIEAANPADRIVVFGSFYTVGGVLVNGIPRLNAKHLGA